MRRPMNRADLTFRDIKDCISKKNRLSVLLLEENTNKSIVSTPAGAEKGECSLLQTEKGKNSTGSKV